MNGYLHHYIDFPQEVDPIKENVYTYEYALKATKEFAEKVDCGPLKVAINAIKKRSANPEGGINPKNPAAKIVIEGNVYKECLEYFNTKCKE